MHTFMFGLVLLASALTSPDDKKAGDREGADRQAMSGPQIDGTWMVVSMERMGQPAAAGANTTVTIRKNVLSFGGTMGSGATKSDAGRAGAGREEASRAEAGMPQSWRLEFLGDGRVRATPVAGGAAGTDRSGTATGRAGTRDTDRPGTGAAGSDRTGGDAQAAHGPQVGVYVQTRDYLCISFSGSRAGDTGRPGGTGAGGDRSPTGTARDAGAGSGTGGSSRTGAAAGEGSGSHGQAAFALVLRRQGAGAGTGSDR